MGGPQDRRGHIHLLIRSQGAGTYVALILTLHGRGSPLRHCHRPGRVQTTRIEPASPSSSSPTTAPDTFLLSKPPSRRSSSPPATASSRPPGGWASPEHVWRGVGQAAGPQ